jgi:hypothetical protein
MDEEGKDAASKNSYCNRSAPTAFADLRWKVSNFLAPSDLAW